jgi:Dienelactone hydrolase family
MGTTLATQEQRGLVARMPGAGHAFFSVDRPAFRPEAAVDGWTKIFDFLDPAQGPSARVAVEPSEEAALALSPTRCTGRSRPRRRAWPRPALREPPDFGPSIPFTYGNPA